ncbi:unnamed protein product [Cuscuta campestris]|uniref:Protein LOW PSII ACCUMULATION 2, chloroplastic n=1 Tax=Cuscuta campestris TaxID=132261 RepID=A0A484LWF1_9ASTE|nr:unnamed protein product [Cuscuta campestris]
MALILPLSSSSFITKKKSTGHLLPHRGRRINLSAKSRDPSPSEDAPSSTAVPPQKRLGGAGLGFGSSTPKTQQKGERGRASVIRRAPIEKPKFDGRSDNARPQEPKRSESAFLIAWLGLGATIIVEGIVLSASGFLPEQWDNFFAKYLYPSFTPTIALFLAGTVTYGVLKYLQSEKSKSEN